jgi:hypothetical protein
MHGATASQPAGGRVQLWFLRALSFAVCSTADRLQRVLKAHAKCGVITTEYCVRVSRACFVMHNTQTCRVYAPARTRAECIHTNTLPERLLLTHTRAYTHPLHRNTHASPARLYVLMRTTRRFKFKSFFCRALTHYLQSVPGCPPAQPGYRHLPVVNWQPLLCTTCIYRQSACVVSA